MNAQPPPALTADSAAELWGKAGEAWAPDGNLPDFSYAGYARGEKPLPELPRGTSVKDFGATGDGVTDDTAAFLTALEKVNGAIEIPAGRYVITEILEVKRSGVVLRGEGPEKTVLVCPRPLNEIKEHWSATTGGLRTSNYSWSGGMVWFKGSLHDRELSKITAPAQRGDYVVEIAEPRQVQKGQEIMVILSDDEANTLADHLYTGDAGDTSKLNGRTRARLVATVTQVEGSRLTLDRPLRFDIRPEWSPVVKAFEPTVTESGIEHLGFEFPNVPYGGHFTEVGFNPLAMNGVAHCWARNLRFSNADSGIFLSGQFCTIERITFAAERQVGPQRQATGHHGIYLGGDDNLFQDFDFRTRFLHDISVSHCAGNVVARGRGVDLCFDHHKRAPYENLFTDLDAGQGTRLWESGGGADLGKHSAARQTFWNIRTRQVTKAPPERFGPASINLVGLWLEGDAPPPPPTPANLYQAQLEKRLGR